MKNIWNKFHGVKTYEIFLNNKRIRFRILEFDIKNTENKLREKFSTKKFEEKIVIKFEINLYLCKIVAIVTISNHLEHLVISSQMRTFWETRFESS